MTTLKTLNADMIRLQLAADHAQTTAERLDAERKLYFISYLYHLLERHTPKRETPEQLSLFGYTPEGETLNRRA